MAHLRVDRRVRGIENQARTLLEAGGMTVDVKVILRNGLIGFALGVVVMLGISYGASTLGSSPPAAPASAR